MLNTKQFCLLVQLKQYGVADSGICAMFTGERHIRPLIRYKYISHNNGIYRLLKKGLEVTAHIQPLITVSGNTGVIERALKTSRLAALFAQMGIQSAGALRDNVFIPSNKWREIRKGITSTARFNGVLCHNGMQLAVYDVGNGDMQWQAFAESSLFFRKYETYETYMTGILLVCDGNEVDIAEQILRYTISNRKALMKRTRLETDKKWSYSTGPIRLRPNYEKVYITDKNGIAETLRLAECTQEFVDYFMKHLQGIEAHSDYDIDVHPTRYFVNPQGDLLKFAKCFDTVKSMVKMQRDSRFPVTDIYYHILISKKFERLAKLYDLPLGYTVVDDNLIKGIMENGTYNEKY